LRRSHCSGPHHAFFHHRCLQPFADQTDQPPIGDPVFDELDEPVVAHRVEEPGDVAVEDEVHAPPSDPGRERIQRIVPATPRPETVAEAEEILLIDRIQHLDHRALDDLVLQRRDGGRIRHPIQ
jgi:hypothetical protein